MSVFVSYPFISKGLEVWVNVAKCVYVQVWLKPLVAGQVPLEAES